MVDFIDKVGIPEQVITNGAPSYTGHKTPLRKLCTREQIHVRVIEAEQKNQNHAAEQEIGMLKKKWRRQQMKKDVPKQLWDCGMVYESKLMNRHARGPDG